MTLKRQETIVYASIWAVVFLFPLTKLMGGSSGDPVSPWKEIFQRWEVMVPLLVLFLAHNFLAAPSLVKEHRKRKYFIVTVLLFILFGAYVFLSRDRNSPERFGPAPVDLRGEVPGRPPEGRPMQEGRPMPEGRPVPEGRPEPEGRPTPEGDFRQTPPPPPHGEGDFEEFRGKDKGGKAPMRPLAPEMVQVLFALLVIGANLSIKQFFKAIQDERDMEELEQEKLESQLQYLRYQISPHFFMNTLNNIHALVDIDPDKSKDSIVQLSKLMRYMLYEGDKPTIPIDKEISFLTQYVSLMRLRYADSVRISLSTPEEASGAEIPPLLFISFVENAFKHGISYQEESFVDIAMTLAEGRLIFRCSNSRHDKRAHADKGGIGVGNTRRRLDLLYKDNYTMEVQDDGSVYTIDLDIPSSPEQNNIQKS